MLPETPLQAGRGARRQMPRPPSHLTLGVPAGTSQPEPNSEEGQVMQSVQVSLPGPRERLREVAEGGGGGIENRQS